MPGERRARVRAGRDPYARPVCHPHTLAVTFGDRARALDDDRIERIRIVEKRLHHEKRGNDGDIALFDDAHGSLVKEGRVLDRVDPRLRSHAHPARTVGVCCDAQPSVVRLGHGGRGLFWRVLRYLGRGAVAEDAASREELDHLCTGGDLLAHGLAHFVRTIRDAAHFETVATGRRDPAAACDDARTLEESLFDRAAEVDDHRAVRAEVADRGHAGAERRARVAKRFERRERVRLPHLGTDVRLAVQREMAMAVDHPRYHEPAGRWDDLGTLALRCLRDRASLTDPGDLCILDDDRGVRHRSCAIEEAIDLEDCPHAPGSIVRRCPTRSSSVFARAASYHRTTTVAGSSTSPPRSSRFWACVTRPTLRRYARSSRRCARGSGR